MREHVAKALAEIGPASAPAVRGLMKLLQDDRGSVRLAAIEALGAIGPGANEAVAAIKALADEDKYAKVREAATLAIETITSG